MFWLKTRFMAYGALLATAGVKVLTTPEAKKAYTKITAYALRCSDDMMKGITVFKEECEDILSDAKAINEEKALAEETKYIEDAAKDKE